MHARTEISFLCLPGLFTTQEAPDGSIELTPELVDAAVTYVRVAMKTKRNRAKSVYKNAMGSELTAETIKSVLEYEWLSSGVSPLTRVIFFLSNT